MTKLNITSVLAGAATAAGITIAASGSALAHGGGMGHMGGSIGGNMGHNTVVSPIKTVTLTKSEKVVRIDRDRRRFRFGGVDVVTSPVCYYKWTNLGRVRICPGLDY
jgi:hypothetical protein